MEKLIITENRTTPSVNFDPEKHTLEITGRSFPEDARTFYKPVFDWLEEYLNNPPPSLTVKFNMYYLSSSSLISIKNILLKIKEFIPKGTRLSILWHFDPDDDDIIRAGEDYVKLTGLHMEFVENPEDD
jgi:hypothetical protein